VAAVGSAGRLALILAIPLLASSTGTRGNLLKCRLALILAIPLLAAAGFFMEPWLSGLERPYTRGAAYGCLAGMLLYFVCWSAGREASHAERDAPADRPRDRRPLVLRRSLPREPAAE
jgi:hypothetical protein